MRILVVGAGGVGASIASIAEERDFFDRCVIADVSQERAQKAIDALDDPSRFTAAKVDARDRRRSSTWLQAEKIDVVVNACDPRLNPPIFEAAFEAGCHLPRHGDEPVGAAPRAARSSRWACRSAPTQLAGRRRVGGQGPAGPRGHRRRAGPVRHLRPLRRRPPVRRDRRDRRARRLEPVDRRLRVRPDVLHLDDDRGVPEPAASCGRRSGAGSPPRCSASPRSSTSPPASARWSA